MGVPVREHTRIFLHLTITPCLTIEPHLTVVPHPSIIPLLQMPRQKPLLSLFFVLWAGGTGSTGRLGADKPVMGLFKLMTVLDCTVVLTESTGPVRAEKARAGGSQGARGCTQQAEF